MKRVDEYEPYEDDEDWEDFEDEDWEDERPRRSERRRREGSRRRSSAGRNRRRESRRRRYDDDEGRPGRCPECGSRDYKKVSWTLWGGIIGPAMFSHVKCQDCRTTFNSKSGRSNQTAITVFLLVSLAIGGLIGVIAVCAGAGAIRDNNRRRVDIPAPQHSSVARRFSPLDDTGYGRSQIADFHGRRSSEPSRQQFVGRDQVLSRATNVQNENRFVADYENCPVRESWWSSFSGANPQEPASVLRDSTVSSQRRDHVWAPRFERSLM